MARAKPAPAHGASEPRIVERQIAIRHKEHYRRVPMKRAGRYPWFALEKGQSFFVPVATGDVNFGHNKNSAPKIADTVRSALRLMQERYADRLGNRKFLIMVAEHDGRDGVRVWRLE